MVRSVFAVSAVLLSLSLMGCGDKDADDSGLEGDVTRGETLYASCTACHGADGSGGIDIGGTTSPDLHFEIPDQTDAELEDIIINGYGTAMPSQYTDPQDVADVIAYLRVTFP